MRTSTSSEFFYSQTSFILLHAGEGIQWLIYPSHSWSTEHPKIWLSVPIVSEKIVKYSQFHGDDAYKAHMGSHLPFASFDGAAEMWAKSYDDLMAVSLSCSQWRIVGGG